MLFGTTGTAQALDPAGTTPLRVGAVRLALGGAVLLGVCTGLYQLCFFAAIKATGVALGTLLTIGSGPVFAGLLALFLLGEKPARSWITATGLCVVGLGLLLIPVLLTQPLGWLGTSSGLALAAYLGLLTTALAYVLFGRGLAVLPAGPVTTLVLAEPLVATLLGVSLLGERLAALGLAGAAFVLAGLSLLGFAASRRMPAGVATPV